MVKFGAWSTLLGLGAAFGSVVAASLALTPQNRRANRLLAALIGVIVLKLEPYILGFAGFYDAYPWLSFAPFDLTLALGPLLWLYVCQLTSGRLPHRAWRHLLPAGLQAAYSLCIFPLPLAMKIREDLVRIRHGVRPGEGNNRAGGAEGKWPEQPATDGMAGNHGHAPWEPFDSEM